MRKFLLLLALPFLLFACKSSAPSANLSPKPNRHTQAGIKGDWQITNVSYAGSEYFKVNSFQIADSKCLIGSKWNFISNNNKGSLVLTRSDCPAFSSPIVWSISKDGKFGLKFVEAGVKSKKVVRGYLLRISNQSEASFQLIDIVNAGGQNKEITYQFEKIN